ncbi:HTH domain-containing protein [Olleya sp. UBA1516]|uniref:HTH domain-containing protein n=1 Tax=Olleya sp. UBA1516 TaxID=1947013 RepID=UPI0025F8B21F|nr:HTH domain-containing protein [Olleya sp. UBA1516]|tara:strand:+ start:2502 stop:2696 length:195 start_codon:yes stop_codon:yes gene_type:complete
MSGKTSGKIVELIVQNKKVTVPEISKEIGVTERTIYRQISDLKEKNIIRHVGPDKGGYWEVIEE